MFLAHGSISTNSGNGESHLSRAGVMLSEGPGLNLGQNRSHARRTQNIYLGKLLLNVQFPQVADDVSCNNYYQNYKQSKFPAACLSHPVRSSLTGHFDYFHPKIFIFVKGGITSLSVVVESSFIKCQ